jgi:hypothetical protein
MRPTLPTLAVVLVATATLLAPQASSAHRLQPTATTADFQAAAACTRRVYVTFAVYSYMPLPSSNGCWSYERVVQGNWQICHYDGRVSGSGRRWVYDDTSPLHNLGIETSRITSCASGRSYGYEFMARRNGAWRKLNPNGVVTRFFAETYSSNSTVNDYWSYWVANPGIGRPMINVGPASNATARSETEKVCRSVSSNTYIGIYSSSAVSPGNGKLTAIQNGLNACTT